MIVNDPHFMSIPVFPPKTNPPLPIEANAELPFPIPREGLQTIGRRNPEIVQVLRMVYHGELIECALLDLRRQTTRSLLVQKAGKVIFTQRSSRMCFGRLQSK